MSKFNEVIREYIKEQIVPITVNPASLQKVPNSTPNTDALGRLLANASAMLSKSGKLNSEQSGEFQKLLNQDGTYKTVDDFLQKYPTLTQDFQKMGLYTPPTDKSQQPEKEEEQNNPITSPSNTSNTNTSNTKSPSPWATNAPKA